MPLVLITQKVNRKIDAMKEKMKRKKPIAYYKELVPSLVQHGYLRQDTKKSSHQYAVRQTLLLRIV